MKNQIQFLALFILLGFTGLRAQVTQQWIEKYNGPGNGIDRANSMVLDGSNNVYVTGSSIGSGTNYDYGTIKYNSSGVQQWAARYNGPGNSSDEAFDIAVDASGDVYVTGRSRAGSTEYTTDYATIKYNSSGVQEWVARYNGTSGQADEALALVLDSFNNVYVTGQSGHPSLNADIATIKYNSSGVQQWVATYNGPGNDWDKGVSIAVDASLNVYVAGGHSVDWGTAYHDYATIKYDSMGVQQWLATYNGPGNNWDEVVSLGLDALGNVYITGYSTGTAWDIATIKYNSLGVQEWVQTYSSAGNSIDVPTSMIVDAAGNLYISGAITFNYGTIKYNSSGIQQWVATYDASGNFDAANSIAIDGPGNVYVTGQSSRGVPESTKDYATVKYNSSGAQQWVQRHNGTANNWDQANSIAIDNSGGVYVTGYSSVSGSSDYGTIKYQQTVMTLHITALIEGLYHDETNNMVRDTVRVYLRNITYPYSIVDLAKSVLDSSGNGTSAFPNAGNGTPYYIVIKHRNSIETWSSSGIAFSSNSFTYDFTTAANKAFGNNQIQVDNSPLRFAIYSGDVNQDGIVDAGDLSMVDNDVFNFVSGYIVTDVNGDNIVDATDLSIVDNNAFSLVIIIRP